MTNENQESDSPEKITLDIESLVPPAYSSFDEMLAYFTAGGGEQYKDDGLEPEELAEEIRHILRAIAGAREAKRAAETRLQAAVITELGGVGAISPELYEQAIHRIAAAAGCGAEEIRSQIGAVLRTLSCPLD